MIGPQHAREYHVRKKARGIADEIIKNPSQDAQDIKRIIRALANPRTKRRPDDESRAWESVARLALELSLEYERQANEFKKVQP